MNKFDTFGSNHWQHVQCTVCDNLQKGTKTARIQKRVFNVLREDWRTNPKGPLKKSQIITKNDC